MLDLFLQILWLMLPAYAANMIPVFFSRVKLGRYLDSPVDLGRSFMGKRVFGDHKTVKGFLIGTLLAVAVALVQHTLIGSYSAMFAVSLGALMGFGALVGDSVESFIKRRIGIKSGRPFPVFDQIDFPIGALLFASIIVEFDLGFMALAVVISGILSFLADVVGYFLGIKKVWW